MSRAALLLLGLLTVLGAVADEALPDHLQGDVGVFLTQVQRPVRGINDGANLLPYGYFDYQRAFARIDTFGIKTLPVGYGYLELVGRVKLDGYRTDGIPELRGIENRRNPIPLGLGTFQLTPIGGFFLYALHDAGLSRGNLYEASYAAELKLGAVTMYPQFGIEHYSRNYTRYYYGVSGAEAAASGYAAYAPAAATVPFLNAMLVVPLTGDWNVNLYLSRKWLDAAIRNSPLVDKKQVDNMFIALVYRFE